MEERKKGNALVNVSERLREDFEEPLGKFFEEYLAEYPQKNFG